MSTLTHPLNWERIETDLPESGRLTVRIAMPSRRSDLFIAIDSAKRRHLLVEIPSGEPSELFERPSRGISLQTVDMKVSTDERKNFIDVICLEVQGYPALDIIAHEIADALDAGSSILRIALIKNVLAKWRRFWSGINQNLLSREQQIGLFGELWFIVQWLGPSIGFAEAVRAWRGPFGSRNDFEANQIAIEVKTTGRLDTVHQVNGLEQLVEPATGALFLMSISVRDEGSAHDSLPKLIKDIRDVLDSQYDALSNFDSCLYAAGYLDEHATEYEKSMLRIRSEKLYRVSPGFPRLIPSSLNEPLSPGISGVNYELSLDGAQNWCVANAPKEAKNLLHDFFDDS